MWGAEFGGRLRLVQGEFGGLDDHAGEAVQGVVLDLGVSSMQLDQPDRGFSFMRDGPLDMRMGQAGPTAADLVAQADEGVLADILHHYGEERAARRIARAIVARRKDHPITTTRDLAAICRTAPAARQARSNPPRDARLSGDPDRGE